MKRKIFLSVFVVIIVAMPAISRASFFDFFKFDWKNLGAQAKTAVSVEARPEVYVRGDKDTEISYIQKLLADKGLYRGSISGLLGAKTQAAIIAWQMKNGLKATGELDQVTIESIAGVREVVDERGADISLSLKMILGGSYDSGTGLMSTALSANDLVPLTEPYSALGYAFEDGGGEVTTPAVLGVTGNNAIVDWVTVELRDTSSVWNADYSRAALLQADGDVVDVDGVSPVLIQNINPDNYYVLVGHRNHLPVMTADPVDITQLVDMRTEPLFGMGGAKIVSGVQVLWPGDVNRDNLVIYTGADNDRDPILAAVGGAVPTATLSGQYRLEDVNMDGVVKYTGLNNDRDIILQSIGGVVPTNILEAQLPEMSSVMVELVSTEQTVITNSGASDMGEFEITFSVTAIDNDIVIPETIELGNGVHTINEGVEYGVGTDGGQGVTSMASTVFSDADMALGGGYMIEEGGTEEFTATVVLQPQADGLFRLHLDSINWGFFAGALNADKFYTFDLGPGSDFRTDYIFLNAI